jgi:hypothetical protein
MRFFSTELTGLKAIILDFGSLLKTLAMPKLLKTATISIWQVLVADLMTARQWASPVILMKDSMVTFSTTGDELPVHIFTRCLLDCMAGAL